jgi:hypothetical protein
MKSLSLALIAIPQHIGLAAQPGQWNKSVALDGQTLHYGVTDDKGNSSISNAVKSLPPCMSA